jgi:hypothetical protein
VTIVKSQPIDSSYLLVDDVGERLCATWHTVPSPIRQSDSLIELASACARAAVCTFEDAMARLPTLLDLGILRRNGTIAKRVQQELNKRGARHMGIEDELPGGNE